jgi:hypothetical protein
MNTLVWTLHFAMLLVAPSAQIPDWSAYQSATVAQAWTEAAIVKGATHTIETIDVKYRVETVYTGEHRELIPQRRDLLRRWVKALRHPDEVGSMFAHEIQIRSGEQLYWLPLQNLLLEPFARDAKNGDRLHLHIMYIGAVGSDRVFVINRFAVLD